MLENSKAYIEVSASSPWLCFRQPSELPEVPMLLEQWIISITFKVNGKSTSMWPMMLTGPIVSPALMQCIQIS